MYLYRVVIDSREMRGEYVITVTAPDGMDATQQVSDYLKANGRKHHIIRRIEYLSSVIR